MFSNCFQMVMVSAIGDGGLEEVVAERLNLEAMNLEGFQTPSQDRRKRERCWTKEAKEARQKWGPRIRELQGIHFPTIADQNDIVRNPDGTHTPQSYLDSAYSYLKLKQPADLCQACEKVWGSTSLALKILAGSLGAQLPTHESKKHFAEFLDQFSELGVHRNETNFRRFFGSAVSCHSLFYEDGGDKVKIWDAIYDARDFINELHRIHDVYEPTGVLDRALIDYKKKCNEADPKIITGIIFPHK